ncbi:hypothetical protein G6F56_006616 [Rhizopus delemar]|nr:hypothetical protein G6F56_006616 [Rhizopus delemar]
MFLGAYGELAGQDKAEHLETIKSSSADIVNSACKEVDVCLTILYLITISNRQSSILLQETQLVEFLFELVVRLKEHFTKAFPLKKLMLNVWKILLFTLGDLNEEYDILKKDIRKVCGLPIYQDKEKTMKCTPEDLHAFYNQTIYRYPTFTPKKPLGKELQNPFTITPSKKLIELMGLVEETSKIELPFQTLFPSKNPISQQQQQGAKDDNSSKINEINILPFTASGSMIPHSLSEANRIWLNHLYISVADYQIIHEREKGVNRWQHWKKQQHEADCSYDDEWDHIIAEKLPERHRIKLDYIEKLYKSIVPYFQNIVVVLLKLLLSTMFSGKDKEAEIMEDVNITRNRETTSKAATTNMKTISSIYSHCLTSLNDDWLSTPDGPVDTEDTTIKEKHLRTLIRLYNGKRYIRSLMPSMDEINGQEKMYFYSNVNNGLPDYSVNQSIVLDDVELDIKFKQNYKSFLDKEVYSTDTEDDDDEEEDDDDDNEGRNLETETYSKWNIDTPIPDNRPTTPISAEDLANEINKLYLEELQNEFQMKQQKKKEQEQGGGWDDTSTAVTNAWGETTSFEEEEERQATAQPDPLTGIDWNCLTEEELSRRLTLVEEKTAQRWLNVDMEDPRYLKVLNTCETEIDTDDEGWAIW